MLNHVGELTFIIAGGVVVLFLMRRARGLGGRDRNASATAAFGLMLCGRYAGLIDEVHEWVFVICVAGAMILLARDNLGLIKGARVSHGQ